METSSDDATVLSGRKVEKKQSSKRQRCTYNENNIHRAYTLVTEKKTSVRKAAHLCGVPLTTLRNRLARGVNAPSHLGAQPLLPREEEEKLFNHFLLLVSSGHSPTRKEIIHLATETAISLGKKPANSGLLTKRWYDNFIRRWPQLRSVKTKRLTSRESLTSYFENLVAVLMNHKFVDRPQRMFYVEVAHFQMDEAETVAEPCHLENNAKASGKRPKTTVFSCGTALGTYLPLYIVFEGDNEVLSYNAIPGSKLSVVKLGCKKWKIFRQFLEDHFLPNLPQRILEEPVLVFYDSRSSYVSARLIELCKKDNIILFALPPHTSNTPHPCNNVLFKPLKTFFHKKCHSQLARERTGEPVTRFDVCKHACTSYLEVCTPLNRINFFEKMGIFPLNPQALVDLEAGNNC